MLASTIYGAALAAFVFVTHRHEVVAHERLADRPVFTGQEIGPPADVLEALAGEPFFHGLVGNPVSDPSASKLLTPEFGL